MRSQQNRDVFWQLLGTQNGFKRKANILAAGSLYLRSCKRNTIISKLITDLFIVIRKKKREKNGKVQGFSPAAFSKKPSLSHSFGTEYSE